MKKETLADLTNEKLLKRRDLFKGVVIGFGIIFIIMIAFLIYLFAAKGSKNVPIATLIPIFSLPVTMTPVFITLASLNKEVKARNL
jgi:cation transporter-like permease